MDAQGNGHKTPSEAFRFEGINLEVCCEYPQDRVSLDQKYPGSSPWGTPRADLVRSDHLGVLAAKCGNCGDFLGLKWQCACSAMRHGSDWDHDVLPLPRRKHRR